MKAAFYEGNEKIRIGACSPVAPAPGEVQIRVSHCGICGTDYEQYDGEYHPYFPTIPGHEPLGVIAEIGPQAQQRWGVTVGDRVAVRSRYGCKFL